jgi:hypothetical protein
MLMARGRGEWKDGNGRKMLAVLVNMAMPCWRQERFVETLVEVTFKKLMNAIRL